MQIQSDLELLTQIMMQIYLVKHPNNIANINITLKIRVVRRKSLKQKLGLFNPILNCFVIISLVKHLNNMTNINITKF